jgi:hypothetical protein
MKKLTRFSLVPIGYLASGPKAGGAQDDDFDLGLLPFEVVPHVFIENVSSLIREGEFDIHASATGERVVSELKRIQYAIVHRYPDYAADPITGKIVLGTTLTKQSRSTVRQIAACLRLIRPTRVLAQFCEGSIAEDGSLYNIGFVNPILDESLPISHRQFALHTVHAEALRDIGPMYMQAMTGEFEKFRMAAQMHEAGYFQHEDWKVRFFLWTSALEALFTTQNPNRQHSGSVVAKGRIKDLLGAKTLIYPPDEYLSLLTPSPLTVEDIVDELYCLRNHIAHGDKLPSHYYEQSGREEFGQCLVRAEMLTEAISFIVRRSLLAILKRGLLPHFNDTASSEAYFVSNKLTQDEISKRTSYYNCPT